MDSQLQRIHTDEDETIKNDLMYNYTHNKLETKFKKN